MFPGTSERCPADCHLPFPDYLYLLRDKIGHNRQYKDSIYRTCRQIARKPVNLQQKCPKTSKFATKMSQSEQTTEYGVKEKYAIGDIKRCKVLVTL